jgi:hypothetical protein
VSEWRRHWVITLRWDDPRNSPYNDRERMFTVTAHELGDLVRAARADPHVVAFPYHATWFLAGTQPDRCPRGHPLDGGSLTRAERFWYTCPGCPGHHVYRCRYLDRPAGEATAGPSDCPEVLDPAPGPYCRPRAATAGPTRPRPEPRREQGTAPRPPWM